MSTDTGRVMPPEALAPVALPGQASDFTRSDIFTNIFMPTTVHIPDQLLKSIDRRARSLGISRNRLVVRALEQVVSEPTGWSPEFLQRLRDVDPKVTAAVEDMLTSVVEARRSKAPRDL